MLLCVMRRKSVSRCSYKSLWLVLVIVANLSLFYLLGCVFFNVSPGSPLWLRIIFIILGVGVTFVFWRNFLSSQSRQAHTQPTNGEKDSSESGWIGGVWLLNMALLGVLMLILGFGFARTSFYMHYYFSTNKMPLPSDIKVSKQISGILCTTSGCEVFLSDGQSYSIWCPYNVPPSFVLKRVSDEKFLFTTDESKSSTSFDKFEKDWLKPIVNSAVNTVDAVKSWSQ